MMILSHSRTLAVVLGCLVSIISSTPTPIELEPRKPQTTDAGTPAGPEVITPFLEHESYRLQIEKPDADSYYFGVYSDGFQVKDKDGDPQPVDLVQVDTKTKRLTVYHAMNGLDKAPNRLKMSDILKECWTWTGLQPQELTEVLGYQVANVQMRTAMAACRKTFGLQFSDSFSVTWAETDSSTQKMSCWNALMGTKFGSAIKSSIENFSIGKQLVSINVDNNGLAGKENWDHVYYGFT